MLDKEMSEIREEIQEAQQLFSYGKWQNALEKATENDSEGETPD